MLNWAYGIAPRGFPPGRFPPLVSAPTVLPRPFCPAGFFPAGVSLRVFAPRGFPPTVLPLTFFPARFRPAGFPPRGFPLAFFFAGRPISRDSAKSPHLLGATGPNFAHRGYLEEWVAASENRANPPLFADPPPGRFCGEWARIKEIPARSAEIRRNRHLLGATGRNFVPHGAVVDGVEFSDNPEKSLLFADPPPGRFCGEGARLSDILPGRLRFSEIATYFARRGAISHILDLRPTV